MDTDGLELEGRFLSADALGLDEEHRCALIKTLAFIEAGRTAYTGDSYKPKGMGFNMQVWRNRHSCGTVACLGGTSELLGDVSFAYVQDAQMKSGTNLIQLRELFGLYKDRYHKMGKVTEKQAGVALRNYLETGRANWDAALKTPR